MPLAFKLSLVASIFFILLVVELCRRRKLREHLALVWLLTGLSMLLFSCSEEPVNFVARKLGVDYAPSVLLLAGVFVLFCLNLYLTVAVSALRDQVARLAQEVAVHRLTHETREDSDEPSAPFSSNSR